MMHIFGVRDGRLVRLPLTITDLPTSSGLLWIDLYHPTPDEEQCVEKLLRAAGADAGGDGRD